MYLPLEIYKNISTLLSGGRTMFLLIRTDRNQFIIINWAVILRSLSGKVVQIRVHWSPWLSVLQDHRWFLTVVVILFFPLYLAHYCLCAEKENMYSARFLEKKIHLFFETVLLIWKLAHYCYLDLDLLTLEDSDQRLSVSQTHLVSS